MRTSTNLADFCNPEIPGLGRRPKTAGILWFGIPRDCNPYSAPYSILAGAAASPYTSMGELTALLRPLAGF